MNKLHYFEVFEQEEVHEALTAKEIKPIIRLIKKFNSEIPDDGIDAMAVGTTISGDFYTILPIEYNTEQAIFKTIEKRKTVEDVKPFTFPFKDEFKDQINQYRKEIKAYTRFND